MGERASSVTVQTQPAACYYYDVGFRWHAGFGGGLGSAVGLVVRERCRYPLYPTYAAAQLSFRKPDVVFGLRNLIG